MRKWWTKRLVALAILYFSNALRDWVRAVRARLVAARSNGSPHDVELPDASILGPRCCSEVAASEQIVQRPRLADAGVQPQPLPLQPPPSSLQLPPALQPPPIQAPVPPRAPPLPHASTHAPLAPPPPPLAVVPDVDLVVLVTGPNGTPQPGDVVYSAIEEYALEAIDSRYGVDRLEDVMTVSYQDKGGPSNGLATVQVYDEWIADELHDSEEGVTTAELPRSGRRPPLRLRLAHANTTGADAVINTMTTLRQRHGRTPPPAVPTSRGRSS
jgi:hypothetical protein